MHTANNSLQIVGDKWSEKLVLKAVDIVVTEKIRYDARRRKPCYYINSETWETAATILSGECADFRRLEDGVTKLKYRVKAEKQFWKGFEYLISSSLAHPPGTQRYPKTGYFVPTKEMLIEASDIAGICNASRFEYCLREGYEGEKLLHQLDLLTARITRQTPPQPQQRSEPEPEQPVRPQLPSFNLPQRTPLQHRMEPRRIVEMSPAPCVPPAPASPPYEPRPNSEYLSPQSPNTTFEAENVITSLKRAGAGWRSIDYLARHGMFWFVEDLMKHGQLEGYIHYLESRPT